MWVLTNFVFVVVTRVIYISSLQNSIFYLEDFYVFISEWFESWTIRGRDSIRILLMSDTSQMENFSLDIKQSISSSSVEYWYLDCILLFELSVNHKYDKLTRNTFLQLSGPTGQRRFLELICECHTVTVTIYSETTPTKPKNKKPKPNFWAKVVSDHHHNHHHAIWVCHYLSHKCNFNWFLYCLMEKPWGL